MLPIRPTWINAAIFPSKLASHKLAPDANANDDVVKTLSPAPDTSSGCKFNASSLWCEAPHGYCLIVELSYPLNLILE